MIEPVGDQGALGGRNAYELTDGHIGIADQCGKQRFESSGQALNLIMAIHRCLMTETKVNGLPRIDGQIEVVVGAIVRFNVFDYEGVGIPRAHSAIQRVVFEYQQVIEQFPTQRR